MFFSFLELKTASETNRGMVRFVSLKNKIDTVVWDNGVIDHVKSIVGRGKIWYIESGIYIEKNNTIKHFVSELWLFESQTNEWTCYDDVVVIDFPEYVFAFGQRIAALRIDDEWCLIVLLLDSLRNLFDPNSVGLNLLWSALTTFLRSFVARLANMAHSEIVVFIGLMIGDSDITIVAFWNMTTIKTQDSFCIRFFVDDDSEFFVLWEGFVYGLLHEIRIKMMEFISHIYEENFFGSIEKDGGGSERCGFVFWVVEKFVGHNGTLIIKSEKR